LEKIDRKIEKVKTVNFKILNFFISMYTMKKRAKKIIGQLLIAIGMVLIIAKAIDYFIPGKSLIPGLIFIGLLLIALGAFLIKKGPDLKAPCYAMPKKYKKTLLGLKNRIQ
jgi:hypothetical protein